jgi:Threonine dehydrogenase and related Zn-dependent dehydrogenases
MENRIGTVKQAFHVEMLKRELPSLQEGQVLVKIKACCICGSDLHIFKDMHPSVRLPVTVGHEFTGEIVEVGEHVEKFKIGDRVVVEPAVTCGTCDACRHGEYGYCENITFTYRVGDGAFADYFIGHEEKMYHLPQNISYQEGALVEPLAVAIHAVKRANVRIGDKVVVIGAGAIGIMVAAICHKLGAKEVLISDLSQFRLDMALRLGATKTVNPVEEDIIDTVAGMTQGKGVDHVFECVGQEKTFQQAFELVRQNGLITDIGIFEKPEIKLDISQLVKKEIRVQGSQGYCWDFEDALQLLEELPLGELITHTFKLEELQQAFDTAIQPEHNAIKVCVTSNYS